MDKEIKEFTDGVKAYEPEQSNEAYTFFRSLFKKSNYFLLKGRFVIVKISRSPRPFWGVGKKFLEFFKKLEIDYLLVLLVSGREGWVFDKREVEYNIEKGFWKLYRKDENYKINPPLKDKNSFSTHEQFLRKIGLEI